ncbi:hypothetical protein JOB18_004319 [Solea senegalensis]|uniref:Uncharacterized protein n=1 Tax=Solea senegalensis TaxID=28829 RepID=A0AAV6QRK6_SOLSE|nr:hypothetical protein JOB18_004319 [Solea senegalensis]
MGGGLFNWALGEHELIDVLTMSALSLSLELFMSAVGFIKTESRGQTDLSEATAVVLPLLAARSLGSSLAFPATEEAEERRDAGVELLQRRSTLESTPENVKPRGFFYSWSSSVCQRIVRGVRRYFH